MHPISLGTRTLALQAGQGNHWCHLWATLIAGPCVEKWPKFANRPTGGVNTAKHEWIDFNWTGSPHGSVSGCHRQALACKGINFHLSYRFFADVPSALCLDLFSALLRAIANANEDNLHYSDGMAPTESSAQLLQRMCQLLCAQSNALLCIKINGISQVKEHLIQVMAFLEDKIYITIAVCIVQQNPTRNKSQNSWWTSGGAECLDALGMGRTISK